MRHVCHCPGCRLRQTPEESATRVPLHAIMPMLPCRCCFIRMVAQKRPVMLCLPFSGFHGCSPPSPALVRPCLNALVVRCSFLLPASVTEACLFWLHACHTAPCLRFGGLPSCHARRRVCAKPCYAIFTHHARFWSRLPCRSDT